MHRRVASNPEKAIEFEVYQPSYEPLRFIQTVESAQVMTKVALKNKKYK